MELRSIYEIKYIDVNEQVINASIAFNKEHAVFEGHFPDNPIVPGVVQIQIVKDLLENALGMTVFLNRSKNIKFLNVINPLESEEIHFEISYKLERDNNLIVKCIIKSDERTYMKYSGIAKVSEK